MSVSAGAMSWAVAISAHCRWGELDASEMEILIRKSSDRRCSHERFA